MAAIPAVCFAHGGAARCELSAETLESLAAPGGPAEACVFVVQKPGLLALKACAELVEDCGAMGRSRRELSRYLLGRARVPAVFGTYSAPGRLRQGVERFLARAGRAGERKPYLLGADTSVFQALWDAAGGTVAPGGTDGDAARRMLALLASVPVPDSLRDTFAGESAEAELVRRLIVQAARSDDPVLVLGETGTGKELVARAIHALHERRSPRRFVAINCGAIPDELLESELFGHTKGAFTGASADKRGMWEEADGGTLFLDEIGDLPLEQQAKILRALQLGEVRRVGATEPASFDVRVVAATNRDIPAMIDARLFREDLYQRLCGVVIRTPSLTAHPEEIPRLAGLFWQKIGGDEPLSASVLGELAARSWRGNIRELKKVLRHMKTLFGGRDLGPEHVRAVLDIREQALGGPAPARGGSGVGSFRAERLKTLSRASELLRACELAMQCIAASRRAPARTAGAELRVLAGDLERLCRKPLLFGSARTFKLVERAASALAAAAASPRRLNGANAAAVSGAVEAASAALFREAARAASSGRGR